LGSDSAVGTEAAPFRSAQKLVDSLSAGQTGCLRGGSYSSSADNVLRPTHGGSASAPLTVRSYPGERAKLVGIVEIVPGIDGITLSGLDIEGTGTGGANSIKIYSRDVVIEDNDITNAWRGRSCVMLGNVTGGGQAVRTIIRRNTFHQCGNPANGNHDHSIYAANITDGEITDNVFYDSAAYTIQFYPNAQNTRFAHNVVDGGSPSIRGGVIFAGDNSYASSNNTVEYNVIAYAATYNITSTWSGPKGSGNTAHDNCVWGGTNSNISTPDGFTAWDNTTTNPNFTDRTNHNYTLTPDSGCPSSAGPRDPTTAARPDAGARTRTTLRVAKSKRPGRGHRGGHRRRRVVRRFRFRGRVRGASRGVVLLTIRRYDGRRKRWGAVRRRRVALRSNGRFRVRRRLRSGRYRVAAYYRGDGRHRASRSRPVKFRA
jgi:hypothetical protein